MSKPIQLKKTDHLPVPIGRDLEAVIYGVRMNDADELQFDLRLCDRRQDNRPFAFAFPAYLTPTSRLSVFLEEVFDVRLAAGETFDPETLIGRPLIVQFGPPDADGHQPIVRWKPIATAATPKTKGSENVD